MRYQRRPYIGTKDVLDKENRRMDIRSCGTKVRYHHRKHAEEARRAMMKKNPLESFDKYKCRHCRYWHVGHTPKWLLEVRKNQAKQQARKDLLLVWDNAPTFWTCFVPNPFVEMEERETLIFRIY